MKRRTSIEKSVHRNQQMLTLAAAMIERDIDRRNGRVTVKTIVDRLTGQPALQWLHGLKPWRVAALLSAAVKLGCFDDYGITLRQGLGFCRYEPQMRHDITGRGDAGSMAA